MFSARPLRKALISQESRLASQCDRGANLPIRADRLERSGNESDGIKINSRGTAEFLRDSSMGEKGEDWRSMAVADWLLEIKEGVMNHVPVSPYEVYEMLMEVNKSGAMGDQNRN